MKRGVFHVVFLIGLLFTLLALILLDYLDIPSLIGLHVSGLNYDLLGAVINAIVVITLYIVTYIIIDKKQIKKDENAKQIANILMLNTYKQCQELLEVINDQDILENYIVPKVDFNKTDLDNPVKMNLISSPFVDHLKILDLASTGVIDPSSYSVYYKVMVLYKNYVSMRITFFDIYKYKGDKYGMLLSSISARYNDLKLLLDKEIDRQKKIIGEE